MEVWKDIKGYEKLYQVSNKGRVRSLDRVVRCSDGKLLKVKGKVLKNRVNRHGYVDVHIYKNCIEKRVDVHRLVAEAFLKDFSYGLEVNHIDLDRTNNKVENLEMVTHQHNVNHSIYFKLFNKGA